MLYATRILLYVYTLGQHTTPQPNDPVFVSLSRFSNFNAWFYRSHSIMIFRHFQKCYRQAHISRKHRNAEGELKKPLTSVIETFRNKKIWYPRYMRRAINIFKFYLQLDAGLLGHHICYTYMYLSKYSGLICHLK